MLLRNKQLRNVNAAPEPRFASTLIKGRVPARQSSGGILDSEARIGVSEIDRPAILESRMFMNHMQPALNSEPVSVALDEAACWNALMNRDARRDGSFYYAVLTTGVFCKPSCPAKRPLPQNVRFFKSPAAAQNAGFRPCRRCQPLGKEERNSHLKVVADLCEFIYHHIEEPIILKTLSRRANLSPFHVQRIFKMITGVTPKRFIEACRIQKLKRHLRANHAVTEALYESGFGSSSRLYERVDTRLGMTPSQYRAGGRDLTITYVTVESPMGLMMIGATDRGLCFVQFGNSEDELAGMLKKEYPAAQLEPMRQPYPEQFEAWMQALTEHLKGIRPNVTLPLNVRATSFQLTVWRYLQSIPYGEVRSYAEVAEAIGRPGSARAVARACASNPVAIAVPCHRVIRGNGELGGYRWGLPRKRVLIDLERASAAR